MSHEMPNPAANNGGEDSFAAWEAQMADNSELQGEASLEAVGDVFDLPDTEREAAYTQLGDYAHHDGMPLVATGDPFDPNVQQGPNSMIRDVPAELAASHNLPYDVTVFAQEATDSQPAANGFTAKRSVIVTTEQEPGSSENVLGTEQKRVSFSYDPQLGPTVDSQSEIVIVNPSTGEKHSLPSEALTLAETRSAIAAVQEASKPAVQ